MPTGIHQPFASPEHGGRARIVVSAMCVGLLAGCTGSPDVPARALNGRAEIGLRPCDDFYLYGSTESSLQEAVREARDVLKTFTARYRCNPGRGILIVRHCGDGIFVHPEDEPLVALKTSSLFRPDRAAGMSAASAATGASPHRATAVEPGGGAESRYLSAMLQLRPYYLDREDRARLSPGIASHDDAAWAVVVPSFEMLDYALSQSPPVTEGGSGLAGLILYPAAPFLRRGMHMELRKKWRVVLYAALAESCGDWTAELKYARVREFMVQELGASMADAYASDDPAVVRW
jgi:hypothetical protein